MISPCGQNCLRVEIGYEANFEFGENSVQLLVGILEVEAYAVQPVEALLGTPRQADQEFVATQRKKVNQERARRGKQNKRRS